MSRKSKQAQAETPVVEKESRDSFLPQALAPPAPEEVKAEVTSLSAGFVAGFERVSLLIEHTEKRSIRLTLTIPPLRPCVENRLLPVQEITPEMTASILGGMLARAASSAEKDGAIQHYRKEQEEAEAKERYGKR